MFYSASSLLKCLTAIFILISNIFYNINIDAEPCPGLCNGHGRCDDAFRQCWCHDGYQGGDCSEMICPFGPAWTDQAVGIDDAHNEAECSNMGECDRTTGLCICRDNFEGKACERKSCPNNCNHNGQCQSMEYRAHVKDPGTGEVYIYEDIWDARMMWGCNCDPGYHGPDCSLRWCPSGDDPMTGNVASTRDNPAQFNEVQKIKCSAGTGYFTLNFRGKTTQRIPYNAKATAIENYLEELTTIGDVKIVMFDTPGQACADNANGNTWTVEFMDNFGDVPMLTGDATGLEYPNSVYTVTLDIAEQRVGTKEDDQCSNRGICDPNDGYCTCEVGYDTSNGYDQHGQRGDCGFVLTTIQQCPGILSCSGHGKCSDSPRFRCDCSQGWTGADCSDRTCPHGTSWFTEPEADNLAHVFESVECSDMGVCNRATGVCECMDGFTGASCNRMTCPVDSSFTACHGHGVCHDMSTLAEEALVNGVAVDFTYGATPNDPNTWDAFRMQGCLCDEGWTGYDCSLRLCPFGDDPYSWHQYDEIQKIYCDDANVIGTFVLTYKEQDTIELSASVTKAELEEALEALPTIGEVEVNLEVEANADSLCLASGNAFLIRFQTEHGDLPLLQIAKEFIDNMDISESTKGTKEHWECSGRGLCDRTTGDCACFTGFGSSNGMGDKGINGDCGYCEPIIPR